MEIVKYYVGQSDAPKTTHPAHLGANILVLWDNKLLLERRRDCNRWGLLGGGCRRGESLDRCAVRELWEETGLRCQPSQLLPLKFYDAPERIAAFQDGSVWKMYMKLFALRLSERPQLRISAESKELRFFSWEELKQIDIVQTHRDLVLDYLPLLMPNARQTALDYLNHDRLLHIDMIEPILRGHGEILFASPRGVLLHERNSSSYLLSADSVEVEALMLPMFRPTGYLAVHHDYEVPSARQRFGLNTFMSCYQVIYPICDTPIWGDVRVLDASFAAQFHARYHLSEGEEWARSLLSAGRVLGQFVDGRLAGFIGSHPEGAVGMLEVFPEYRRQGIGQNLIRAMAHRWQEKGCTAFAQVDFQNAKSLALQQKLGAARSETMLHWLWFEP